MAGVGGWAETWQACHLMISALVQRYVPRCGCQRLSACAHDAAQAARALNDASSAGFGTACNGDVDAPRSGPGWVPRACLARNRQGWVGGGSLTHPPPLRPPRRVRKGTLQGPPPFLVSARTLNSKAELEEWASTSDCHSRATSLATPRKHRVRPWRRARAPPCIINEASVAAVRTDTRPPVGVATTC